MPQLRQQIKKDAKLILKGRYGISIAALFLLLAISLFFMVVENLLYYVLDVDFAMNALYLYLTEQIQPHLFSLLIPVGCGIVGSLVILPLWVGLNSLFFKAVEQHDCPVSQMFEPFARARSYFGSLYLSLSLFIRKAVILFLFLLPGCVVIGFGVHASQYGLSNIIRVLGMLCLLLGTAILGLCIVFYAIFIKRYALAAYLYCDSGFKKPEQAIRRSVRYTKGHQMQFFILDLTFIPAFAACLFVIPALYFGPYICQTAALYSKYFIENGKIGESGKETV